VRPAAAGDFSEMDAAAAGAAFFVQGHLCLFGHRSAPGQPIRRS